jgi:catechol-2,3-dioxygenase
LEHSDSKSSKLDQIDHVAIHVEDLKRAVSYYQETFRSRLLYQDDTWAFLQFNNIRLALVSKNEHPRHIAIEREDLSPFGPGKEHRDGTVSTYTSDPEGNSVEVIKPYEAEKIFKS